MSQQHTPEVLHPGLQGVKFTTTEIGGVPYLLAANNAEITEIRLQIKSTASLYQVKADSEDQAKGPALPESNRLLNYVHSSCKRFPVDDSLSILSASKGSCRTVTLQCVTGAQLCRLQHRHWSPVERLNKATLSL